MRGDSPQFLKLVSAQAMDVGAVTICLHSVTHITVFMKQFVDGVEVGVGA